MKLGRNPHDPVLYARLPHVGSHLEAIAAQAPEAIDWSRDVAPGTWGMCVNDTIGDCTCAAVAHAIALWESHCPPLTFMPDSDVVALYSVVSGYKPGDPATDTGARCSDVLSQWLTDGVPCAGELDRLSAFATLDPKNRAHITAAIWTFGCLYAGVVLHESDIDNFEQSQAWADATGAVEGGHCILLCAADSSGPTCITWGQTQKMTWAWWDACTEECYALLSPRWLAAGKTPGGFPLDALLAEMAALKQ